MRAPRVQSPAMVIPPEDEVVLEEPWVTIRWDSALGCLHSEWKGFATSAEFRAALMTAAEAFKKRHLSSYISDTRKIKVIVHADQKWLEDVWIPLLVSEGLKRFALVTAASGLGKATVEDVITLEDNRRLLMRKFDSVSAAERWIGEGG